MSGPAEMSPATMPPPPPTTLHRFVSRWLCTVFIGLGIWVWPWDAAVRNEVAWGIWLSGAGLPGHFLDIGPWLAGWLYRTGGRVLVETAFLFLLLLAWFRVTKVTARHATSSAWLPTPAEFIGAACVIGFAASVQSSAISWLLVAGALALLLGNRGSRFLALIVIVAAWLGIFGGLPTAVAGLITGLFLPAAISQLPAVMKNKLLPELVAVVILLATFCFRIGSWPENFEAPWTKQALQLVAKIPPSAKAVIPDHSGTRILMFSRPDLVSPSQAATTRGRGSVASVELRMGPSVEALILGPESLENRGLSSDFRLSHANSVGSLWLKDGEEKPGGDDLAIGAWLHSAGRRDEARRFLESARKADPKNPEAPARLAAIFVEVQRLGEAVRMANLALSIDPNYAPALSVKAQVLYGGREFIAAYDTAKIWSQAAPEDPDAWFHLARLARQVKAERTEVEALEKLIALAEEQDCPTGGYWIFLGQAHARQGNGPVALECFREAGRQPELNAEQRTFLHETIDRISSHLNR